MMQMGIILINTAELIRRPCLGIYTTIITLGLHRGVTLAFWLAIAGSAGSLASLAWFYNAIDPVSVKLAGLLPAVAACIFVVIGISQRQSKVRGTRTGRKHRHRQEVRKDRPALGHDRRVVDVLVGGPALLLPIKLGFGRLFFHQLCDVKDVVDAGEDGEGDDGGVDGRKVEAVKSGQTAAIRMSMTRDDLDEGARLAEP